MISVITNSFGQSGVVLRDVMLAMSGLLEALKRMDVLLSVLIQKCFHFFDTLMLLILAFLDIVKNCERMIN